MAIDENATRKGANDTTVCKGGAVGIPHGIRTQMGQIVGDYQPKAQYRYFIEFLSIASSETIPSGTMKLFRSESITVDWYCLNDGPDW